MVKRSALPGLPLAERLSMGFCSFGGAENTNDWCAYRARWFIFQALKRGNEPDERAFLSQSCDGHLACDLGRLDHKRFIVEPAHWAMDN